MTAPLHPQVPEDGGRDAHAAWAAHLEGCASCRARVLADDPTRLFVDARSNAAWRRSWRATTAMAWPAG